MRETLMQKLIKQYEQDSEHFPVVDIEDYFEGCTDEYCIAPNRWEFGRPPIAQMYQRFKEIKAKDNVQTVMVGMHQEWSFCLDEPEDYDWPAAENIHIITSATREEIWSWVEDLAADEILEGWPYDKHLSAPEPKEGYKVYSVCWD